MTRSTRLAAIIANHHECMSGTTMYEGREPTIMEIMVGEVERLRAVLRVNLLRAGYDHGEIDAMLEGGE